MNQAPCSQRSPRAVTSISLLIATVFAAISMGCASVPDSIDTASAGGGYSVSEVADHPDLAALDLPDNLEPIDPLQAP